MLPWYVGTHEQGSYRGRARSNWRAHGKAPAQSTKSHCRTERYVAWRLARGHRPACLRRQGPVLRRHSARDRAIQEDLRTHIESSQRPPLEGTRKMKTFLLGILAMTTIALA